MFSEQIRQKFFDFFEKRGHKIVFSSSLVPDDPSVLLTTAGMQQFKRYYTGELNALKEFGSQRTISIQKCFRTSDIEEVGDNTHLTFFEMLGNFSFGPVGADNPEDFGTSGYFKRSSIFWAYEFVIDVLGIKPERITVSIFGGDPEETENSVPFDEQAYNIWHKEVGLAKDKIICGKREDNFWGPTGDEGPCGPTTEIYVDGIEIWNLVFNEYYQEKGGLLRKAENPGVDTGMGFERLVAVLQGVDDVFETDIFKDFVFKISEFTPHLSATMRKGAGFVPGKDKKIVKILADHLRASIFLTADGIRPSNKEAGYILRRLLRRILAYSIKYDIHADLFPESVDFMKAKFGKFYPELNDTKAILGVLEEERLKFQEAIGKGLKAMEKYGKISAKEAFYLYETFGLPFEVIKELAGQKIKNLNKSDFEKEFAKEFEGHQEISRAGAEKKFGGHGLVLNTGELKAVDEEEMKKVIRLHTATHILQWALREVLGKDVRQTGSDINAERLRFDFSFNRKMTTEEIKKVEELVNSKIKENLPVYFKEMPKSDAEKIGALAFFKAKYPEIVKIYFIGPISKEFCGGPHVNSTAEIAPPGGGFKILKEEAVAAGIRRIRAIVE